MKLYGDHDPNQVRSMSIIQPEAITTLATAVYEFVKEDNSFELHQGMLCEVGNRRAPLLEIDLSDTGVFYVYHADAIPPALLQHMAIKLGINSESVLVLLRYAEQGRNTVPASRVDEPTLKVDVVPTVEVATVTEEGTGCH